MVVYYAAVLLNIFWSKIKYIVCPKSNENDFFEQRRRARKGKWGLEAGGGGTQVYSLTFLS